MATYDSLYESSGIPPEHPIRNGNSTTVKDLYNHFNLNPRQVDQARRLLQKLAWADTTKIYKTPNLPMCYTLSVKKGKFAEEKIIDLEAYDGMNIDYVEYLADTIKQDFVQFIGESVIEDKVKVIDENVPIQNNPWNYIYEFANSIIPFRGNNSDKKERRFKGDMTAYYDADGNLITKKWYQFWK